MAARLTATKVYTGESTTCGSLSCIFRSCFSGLVLNVNFCWRLRGLLVLCFADLCEVVVTRTGPHAFASPSVAGFVSLCCSYVA